MGYFWDNKKSAFMGYCGKVFGLGFRPDCGKASGSGFRLFFFFGDFIRFLVCRFGSSECDLASSVVVFLFPARKTGKVCVFVVFWVCFVCGSVVSCPPVLKLSESEFCILFAID